jgi:hypothetical protein
MTLTLGVMAQIDIEVRLRSRPEPAARNVCAGKLEISDVLCDPS